MNKVCLFVTVCLFYCTIIFGQLGDEVVDDVTSSNVTPPLSPLEVHVDDVITSNVAPLSPPGVHLDDSSNVAPTLSPPGVHVDEVTSSNVAPSLSPRVVVDITSGDSKEFIENLDNDGNGNITIAECNDSVYENSEEACADLFDKIDIEKKGFITTDQIKTYINTLKPSFKKVRTRVNKLGKSLDHIPPEFDWREATALGSGAFGTTFSVFNTDAGGKKGKVAVKLIVQPIGADHDAFTAMVQKEIDALVAVATFLKVSTAFSVTWGDLPEIAKIGILAQEKYQKPIKILSLPNVTPIVGLVTNLITGDTIEDWLPEADREETEFIFQAPADTSQRYDVMKQYSIALGCIRERGYQHRDIKPANLMIFWSSFLGFGKLHGVVIDYGLMEKTHISGTQCLDREASGEGGFVGTPGYIPPPLLLAGERECVYGPWHQDEYALGTSGSELHKLYREMMAEPDAAEVVALDHKILVSNWPGFTERLKIAAGLTKINHKAYNGRGQYEDIDAAKPWIMGGGTTNKLVKPKNNNRVGVA